MFLRVSQYYLLIITTTCSLEFSAEDLISWVLKCPLCCSVLYPIGAMKNNVELADYYFLNYRQSVYVAIFLIELN